MVEALFPYGPYPALRDRVRPGRSHRDADGLDADRGEHRVRTGGELGVPVADEEPESPTCLFDIRDEVAGDLGNPWAIRVGGRTEDVDDEIGRASCRERV